MAGWRTLGLLWLAVIVVAGGGAVGLQVMGPPEPVSPHATPGAPAVPQVPPPGGHAATPASVPAPSASVAEPEPSGDPVPASDIVPPDPALLEPAPDFPPAQLPKIGPRGRMPMRVYAARFDSADKRPRIGMLVVGFGLSTAESALAMATLPAPVSLGFSPYSHDIDILLTDARIYGHEYLVGLPMESQGYPLNDSGPRALLTSADPATNTRNLEWILSRIQGAVGLTGASDGLRGERFAAAPTAFEPVRAQLAARGLLYVDPRPGAAAAGAAVAITAVVDDPPQRADIDAKLAKLEQQARGAGWALGLAGPLRPVTIDRIVTWARGLDSRGIALVPVSALVPATPGGHK